MPADDQGAATGMEPANQMETEKKIEKLQKRYKKLKETVKELKCQMEDVQKMMKQNQKETEMLKGSQAETVTQEGGAQEPLMPIFTKLLEQQQEEQHLLRQLAAEREKQMHGQMAELQGIVQSVTLGQQAMLMKMVDRLVAPGPVSVPTVQSQASVAPAPAQSAVHSAQSRQPALDSADRLQNGSRDGVEGGGLLASQMMPTGDALASQINAAIQAVDDGDVLADINSLVSSPLKSNGASSQSQAAFSAPTTATPSSGGTAQASTEAVPAAAGASQEYVYEEDSDLPMLPPDMRETPEGPPPTLAVGDDDIFWVNQLHAGLLKEGYYPGEDDMENWYFGDQTMAALLTFQACSSLAQTGVADEETWKALLGKELKPITPNYYKTQVSQSGAQEAGEAIGTPAELPTSTASSQGSSSQEADTSMHTSTSTSTSAHTSTNGNGRLSDDRFSTPSAKWNIKLSKTEDHSTGATSKKFNGKEWPTLMETDGGLEVHAMQVLLDRAGYYGGEADLQWWQFGSSTQEALRAFQACSGLPQSGVCDKRTWLALLGDDNASISQIYEVQGEQQYEDDMTNERGRVWLIGEQRWEEKSTVRS